MEFKSYDFVIVLVKVDVNDEKNKFLVFKYGIKGFLIFKIFKKGGSIVLDYKGFWDVVGIVVYLK